MKGPWHSTEGRRLEVQTLIAGRAADATWKRRQQHWSWDLGVGKIQMKGLRTGVGWGGMIVGFRGGGLECSMLEGGERELLPEHLQGQD